MEQDRGQFSADSSLFPLRGALRERMASVESAVAIAILASIVFTFPQQSLG